MQEIKITRAQTLKEKPESSTLVFGKSMTDHMFIVDYDAGQGWHDPRIVPYAPLMIWATHVLQWRKQREAKPRGGANPKNNVSVRTAVCNSTARSWNR